MPNSATSNWPQPRPSNLDAQIQAIQYRLALRLYSEVSDKTLKRLAAEVLELELIADERAILAA
jgi:hypothetical protein